MNRDDSTPMDDVQGAPRPARVMAGRPMPLASIAAVMTAIAFVVALAVGVRYRNGEAPRIAGIEDSCRSRSCVSPDQLIGATEARALKGRLGNHLLLVDISSTGEAPAIAPDVRAPFVEGVSPSGLQFRIDFGDRMDDALRAARMKHDEPVVVMAPSPELGVLAALFLQERGYSDVRVLRG